MSIVSWDEKGDPQEKQPDHPQAELGLSHNWPQLGSNPQQWHDERLKALKISDLNHSAIGAAKALKISGLNHSAMGAAKALKISGLNHSAMGAALMI